ncbi:histidinol-phosphate transaminase [Anaerocolumna sp. MB42-C2]|uniref:histidinol-phosphate transaminase n=1 Tax=Anaerocolumna sp. MB42-C2 TaxID=3070997 RepID=UPI0027DEC1A6|nr:histidinol-phosphate transaminase [Anaerocolumna sp. MB42-C2]WMJ86151.1 histidinol-phosphate transaminase [Anaerocolumna sp. MB42-C2]
MKAWENNIRKVVPYTPGEQPDSPNMIKLNTNENPYPPAPGVQKAIREFKMERLKLYPDPKAKLLIKALADYYKLEESQVFVGVGSDDVLAMAFMTFFNSDKPILFPDITYSFYDVWADLFRIPYEQPALDANFRIRKEDYYRENGGIVIANPNAPTSIYEGEDFIRDILEHNQDSIVIVDEAYIDFGGRSSLELIKEFDNLLVVQTFSKSRSMAGMRIGYAMGNPILIKAINDVKYSYNSYTMNQTSLYYGVEAVRDEAYFKETLEKIMKTREWVKEEMKRLEFTFPDSKTNFIFASHKYFPAVELFNALRKENVFVRYFNKPGINNYLRITIGTDEEMKQLLKALEQIINRK